MYNNIVIIIIGAIIMGICVHYDLKSHYSVSISADEETFHQKSCPTQSTGCRIQESRHSRSFVHTNIVTIILYTINFLYLFACVRMYIIINYNYIACMLFLSCRSS